MADALDQKGLAQAALTYKRQHRNTCYPDAMDSEALIAAEAIVRAYLSTVIPAEIAEVVEDLRGHTCGCGGPCGQKTPPYLRQAATLIERLAASQVETSDPYTRQSAADLVSEIDRDLPPDFPNYADWSITIPAGHWRAIRALIDRPSTEGGRDG